MTPGPIPRRAVLVIAVLVAVLGLLVVAVLGRSDGSFTASAPDPSSTVAPAPAVSEPSPSAPPTSAPGVVPPVADPGVPVESAAPDPTTSAPGGPVTVEPEVEAAIAADGSAPVLVGLAVPDGLAPEERAVAVAAAADEVLAALPAGVAATAKPTGTTAMLALTVDADGLAALRGAGVVAAVSEDGINTIDSTNSPVSIQAPQAWAQGADGTGQVIAVLDTGVARNHPYLTSGGVSDVLAEACFSSTFSNVNGPQWSSYCPGGSTAGVFGVGVAAPCSAPVGPCEHGTHVAGIAAGGTGAASLASGVGASGIAPDAELLGVQVFSKGLTAGVCGGSAPCAIAFDSDVIRGLEWVYAQRSAHPGLVAVNLSLGGGKYPGTCDANYSEMTQAIDDLRSVGIATVVASGNSGWRGFTSGPACISSAVAVGAVDDATGQVAGYSNQSSVVDLLGPGSSIRSSFPPNTMGNLSGTSMATPAVAGAFAALREARPSATVDQLEADLKTTGQSINTATPAGGPWRYLQLDAPVKFSLVGSAGALVPLTPARLMDTREEPQFPTVDGQVKGEGPLGAGTAGTRSLPVLGRGLVPASGVAAVALNVTVTGPTAASWLRVYPSDVALPNASNLNYSPGQTVPNMVIAGVGSDGRVAIHNQFGQTDVIVDVLGWFPFSPGFTPLPAPARFMDTRPGAFTTVDGQFQGAGALGAGTPGLRTLKVTDRPGVPASGVGAVALNVTVTSPTASSWLRVFPTGSALPIASSLNYGPAQTVPNMVIVQVGTNGDVSFRNEFGSAHVIVDVVGWFPSAAGFASLSPARILDTRPGFPTFDGTFGGVGAIGQGQTLALTVAGRGGVPPVGARAVALNVTVTSPTAASWLRVHRSGALLPTSSNLNYLPGQTVPNMVVVAVGADGRILLRNELGSTHVIVDVLGWFP